MSVAKPRLKLYHAAPSRSSVARWMLEETGEPYEIEFLSLKGGDQTKPEFRAINPMGKVPTLVDDGVVDHRGLGHLLLPGRHLSQGVTRAADRRQSPRSTISSGCSSRPSCIEPAMIDKALNRPPAPRSTAGWADYDTVIEVLRAGDCGQALSSRRAVHRRRRRHRLDAPLGNAVQDDPRSA